MFGSFGKRNINIWELFDAFIHLLIHLLVMNIEHNMILVLLTSEERNKVADYYEKQERLLEGFVEMETITETGCMPGSLTEVGRVHQDNEANF